MNRPVTIIIPPWLPTMVKERGITEKEAAEMLQWAYDQVHIAAAVYAAVSRS